MYLNELDQYDSITIQAHDNPDADAIASGYALYVYFQAKGKNVSLFCLKYLPKTITGKSIGEGEYVS